MDERVLIETLTTVRSQVEIQSGMRRLGQLSGAQLCTCQFPFQCQTIKPGKLFRRISGSVCIVLK